MGKHDSDNYSSHAVMYAEPAEPAEPAESAEPSAVRRSAGVTRKPVIPPAVLARRMQRYAVYLMVMAFLLLLGQLDALSPKAVLWFASGLAAAFALLCAVAVVILNAIAWNFDRLREELRGGRGSLNMR
jgi:hypothetical protein